MKKTKAVSLIIAVILCALALSACGSDKSPDDRQTGSAETTAPVTTEKVSEEVPVSGKCDIVITESENEAPKLIPGECATKDTRVEVKGGSDDAYVFLKVDIGDDLDAVLRYEIESGWTPLEGVDGVYWREYASDGGDTLYGVFVGDTISVRDDMTSYDAQKVYDGESHMTIQAYAYVKAGAKDASDAWVKGNFS